MLKCLLGSNYFLRYSVGACPFSTDGIVLGLQEGQPAVDAQSSTLGNAAVPTAAETQARVDKMDLGNKAFLSGKGP